MRYDWARYIFASVADYFKEVTDDVPVWVDHLDERSDALMKATDRAEVRITGPFIKHVSKDYYVAYVDVSVLLVSRLDGPRKNAYAILKYTGLFEDAMLDPIAIWNFGNEAGDFADDEIFLGCLNPRPGQTVQVLHFGQTNPEEKCKMTEISGKFTMDLFE